MTGYWVVIASFLYLFLLFALAYWAEKQKAKGKSIVNNPYIYALSLAVYCTAWTYYGSVGRASEYGLEFLAIYIGPTIMMPIWWIVNRKIIRICKVQHITSIADFISSRYGKSILLGSIVTILSVVGIIPYISLQLKAISNSFDLLAPTLHADTSVFWQDSAFYITLSLAIFIIWFGTQNIEAITQHEGLITAIAFESILKLIAFLAVGFFVTQNLFGGTSEIFALAQKQITNVEELWTLQAPHDETHWFLMLLLSMLAFMFLPRQFQVAVVENLNEKHLKRALWLLPLYLFVINIFVFPLALAGNIFFTNDPYINADMYVLALPLENKQYFLALLVYIGGFSAATSMIIISTMTLSVMLSNNLIMPLLITFTNLTQKDNSYLVLYFRRLSIVLILLIAYVYIKFFAATSSLVSIGLVSFVAVAQFAPAIIAGIYWKRATKLGAIAGITAGFITWFFTLVIPEFVEAGWLAQSILTEGLGGISLLKPLAFLGMEVLTPITHAFFWSMLFNISFYFIFSFLSEPSSKEHNQAIIFVDIFKYSTVYESAVVWKGTAYTPDIESLLYNFLGQVRTEEALKEYAAKQGKNWIEIKKVDSDLIAYAEKLLAGSIGIASARILIASVVKEEEISKEEVFDILRESQQLIYLNKALEEKSIALQHTSKQLKEVNKKLKITDQQKNDFISTITHEMRTPITSIRAFSEILQDNPKLEEEQKIQFLDTIIKETNRMERLISQVLDLERFETGQQSLQMSKININKVIQDSLTTVSQMIKDKGIYLEVSLQPNIPETLADRDRVMQVILNLLSNAIKYTQNDSPEIGVYSFYSKQSIKVSIRNNGQVIPREVQHLIFEKFFQAKNQTTKKPKGSGLGLAISKKIIQYHEGKIWVESGEYLPFTTFSFIIPVKHKVSNEEFV